MTAEELMALIAGGEGQAIEFKAAFPTQSTDMAKEIAAFATSNDGIILLGVDDDGRVCGLGDDKENLIGRLEGICKHTIDPPITPMFEFISIGSMEVLFVRVPKGRSPIYYVRNVPYFRHMTSASPAKPQDVIDLVTNWSEKSTGNPDAAVENALPEFKRFHFARTDYSKIRLPDKPHGRQIGFWFAAVPIDESIALGRPSDRSDYWPGRYPLVSSFSGNQVYPFLPPDGATRENSPRPIAFYGGASQQWFTKWPFDGTRQEFGGTLTTVSIYSDGRISVMQRSNIGPDAPYQNIRWVMLEIASVLRVVDRICKARSGFIRYAMAGELRYDQFLHEGNLPVRGGEWRLGLIDDETSRNYGMISSVPVQVGPYEIGAQPEWSEFLAQRLQDLYDIAGRDYQLRDLTFEV